LPCMNNSGSLVLISADLLSENTKGPWCFWVIVTLQEKRFFSGLYRILNLSHKNRCKAALEKERRLNWRVFSAKAKPSPSRFASGMNAFLAWGSYCELSAHKII
jgi:hypothetical protein